MSLNTSNDRLLDERLELGNNAFSEGKFWNALEILKELSENQEINSSDIKRACVYLKIGKSHIALKNFRMAKEALNESFKKPEMCLEGGLLYGELLLTEGLYEESLEVFKRVLLHMPDNACALYYSGIANLHLKRIDSAIRDFEKSLESEPNYPASIVAKFMAENLLLYPEELIQSRHRKTIAVMLTPFMRDWLGGQSYVFNFVQTMNYLPKFRRPRLILMVMFDDWKSIETVREIIKRCANLDNIIAIFDRNLNAIFLSKICFKYLEVYEKKELSYINCKKQLISLSTHSFPMLYPMWALNRIGRPIYWVPDLQHEFFPEYFHSEELLSRTISMHSLSMRDVPIIFSSYDALAHFTSFYEASKSKLFVWHFCSTLLPSDIKNDRDAPTKLGLPEKFYYIANQFWRHKNHKLAFSAINILLTRGVNVHVVCSGTDLYASTDEFHKELINLAEKLNILKCISFIGVLDRSDQLSVLRRCCAVIQPSSFEGWSTVIEDAKSFGKPVLASSLTVNIEQLGDEGYFFDQKNPESLAALIEQLHPSLSSGPDLQAENASEIITLARIGNSAIQFQLISDSIQIDHG